MDRFPSLPSSIRLQPQYRQTTLSTNIADWKMNFVNSSRENNHGHFSGNISNIFQLSMFKFAQHPHERSEGLRSTFNSHRAAAIAIELPKSWQRVQFVSVPHSRRATAAVIRPTQTPQRVRLRCSARQPKCAEGSLLMFIMCTAPQREHCDPSKSEESLLCMFDL